MVANDADNTCILEVWDVKTYEEVAAFNAIIDDSTVVILLLNPPLTEVKAPLISVAICVELLNSVGRLVIFEYCIYDALVALVTLFTVTGNVLLFPFVNVIVAFDTDAVIKKLPVSTVAVDAFNA